MRVAPHIRASVTPDGILFLDIASGRMFSANAIGAHIWTRLRDGWREADVAREIACGSGVDEDLVRRDVSDFTAALAASGFLLDRL
jgi:Coenzyme PQQ synthesis protein D (PqqD)